MILGMIFHFLRVIFGFAIKIIAKLLISLSLWLPLLYTLIFVVVCGLAGGSLTQLKSWYFFGLFVSIVGSFALSTYLYERGLKRKKQKKSGSIEPVREKSDQSFLKRRSAKKAERAEKTERAEQERLAGESNAQMQESVDFAAGSAGGNSATTSSANSAANSADSFGSNPAAGYNSTERNLDGRFNSGGIEGDNLRRPDHGQTGFSEDGSAGGMAARHDFLAYDKLDKGQNYGGNNFEKFAENSENSGESFNSGLVNPYQSFDFGGRDSGRGSNRASGFCGEQNGFGTAENDIFGDRSSFAGSPNGFSDSDGTDGSSDFADRQNGRAYGEYQNVFDSPVMQESPKIFATRSDPTVLIYEFSDRLEYYKRTRSGLVLFRTAPKA